MLVEDGDSILKYLQRVSHPEIKFGGGINCNGILLQNLSILSRKIYFSSQEKIAYFLTQEAAHLLVHFKFLRV